MTGKVERMLQTTEGRWDWYSLTVTREGEQLYVWDERDDLWAIIPVPGLTPEMLRGRLRQADSESQAASAPFSTRV